MAGQVAAAKEGAGAKGATATAAAPAGEAVGACMYAQRQNNTGQSNVSQWPLDLHHTFSLQQYAAARQSARVSPAATARCLCPACRDRIPVRPAGRFICMYSRRGLEPGPGGQLWRQGTWWWGRRGACAQEQGAGEATSLSKLRCGCAMLVLACMHGNAEFHGSQECLAFTITTGR